MESQTRSGSKSVNDEEPHVSADSELNRFLAWNGRSLPPTLLGGPGGEMAVTLQPLSMVMITFSQLSDTVAWAGSRTNTPGTSPSIEPNPASLPPSTLS